MKISTEQKRTEAIFDTYRARLDSIPDERFTETPPGGGWSYAEVYSHIMQATLGSAVAIEKCGHSTSKTSGKITLAGRLVLLLGLMPHTAANAQVPDKVRRPDKITKEAARNLIIKCRQKLNDIIAMLDKNNTTGRIKHPRLGYFNNLQWLKFMGIHLKHHLKQLKRIDKSFGN